MKRDLQRLLVDCARAAAGSTVAFPEALRGQGDLVGRALGAHGLKSAAAVFLDPASVPHPMREHLDEHLGEARARDATACLQLALIAHDLDTAGIAWAAFKGPVLAHGVYPAGVPRDYVDLDVLVERKRFAEAVTVIQERGAGIVEQNWREVLHLLKGELNLATRFVMVDVHWSLLYDGPLRQSFRWDDAAHLARRRPVDLGSGLTVPTLDPVSSMLHLALHAGLAGGQKLGWLRDIAFASQAPGLDWDAVEHEARSQGVALPVGAMLRRVRTTLGLGAWPTGLEQALIGRSGWSAVLRGLDTFHPPSRWYGGSLSGHLVMGATRTDTRASLRELRRRGAEEIGIVRTDALHPWHRYVPASLRQVRPAEPAVSQERYRDAYWRAVDR